VPDDAGTSSRASEKGGGEEGKHSIRPMLRAGIKSATSKGSEPVRKPWLQNSKNPHSHKKAGGAAGREGEEGTN